ncbi:MAG TPA: TIGR00730 family Rossman fold protein [Candidatus Paceibacterota bacterium]|nr:TIGR00730 family Rossman fold protein [Candidatus Paceibacterota bacterium]
MLKEPVQPDERVVLNKPEAKLPIRPLTKDEFAEHVKNRVHRIAGEFTHGFEFLEGLERTITFFGSARFKPDNPHYKMARELGQRVSEYGFGVVTGGGPGIMEAGNRGAYETNGESLGLNIHLPYEQATNPYVNRKMEFEYFFCRKVLMSYAAEAYVFFPGGFGTLDEFFEMLTLIQTHKIEKVPVICMGKDFWDPMQRFIKKYLYEENKAIDEEDMELYTITDDIEEALDIIRVAPIRRQN